MNLDPKKLKRLDSFMKILTEGDTKTVIGQIALYSKISSFLDKIKEEGYEEGYKQGVKNWSESIGKN